MGNDIIVMVNNGPVNIYRNDVSSICGTGDAENFDVFLFTT